MWVCVDNVHSPVLIETEPLYAAFTAREVTCVHVVSPTSTPSTNTVVLTAWLAVGCLKVTLPVVVARSHWMPIHKGPFGDCNMQQHPQHHTPTHRMASGLNE